jgi:hypothetical protein
MIREQVHVMNLRFGQKASRQIFIWELCTDKSVVQNLQNGANIIALILGNKKCSPKIKHKSLTNIHTKIDVILLFGGAHESNFL